MREAQVVITRYLWRDRARMTISERAMRRFTIHHRQPILPLALPKEDLRSTKAQTEKARTQTLSAKMRQSVMTITTFRTAGKTAKSFT